MTSTKNHHSQKVADELTHLLADTYTLYLKTQNFHWNVTGGPHFQTLHLMFETQYTELAEAIDEIAERIRALNCFTPASFSHFMKLSSIKEANTELDYHEMLKQLLKDHETLTHSANMMISAAQNAKDEATADMLIQRVKYHEKTAWMLRSSIK